MTINIKLWGILLVIVVGLAFFYIGKGKYQRDLDNASMELYEAHRKIKEDSVSYAVKINGLKRNVFESEAKVVSTTKALKQSEIERERLKKLKVKDVIAISDLELEVDSLKALLVTDLDVIDVVVDEDTSRYAKLPIEAYYKDVWSEFSVTIDEDTSFSILSVDVPITGTIGYKKTGMFKTELYSILDTPVPYVNVSKNNVVVVQPKKKWYERPSVYLSVGLLGGLLLGTL